MVKKVIINGKSLEDAFKDWYKDCDRKELV